MRALVVSLVVGLAAGPALADGRAAPTPPTTPTRTTTTPTTTTVGEPNPPPAAGSPEPAPRRADASWRDVVGGPFPSPRLFAMPVADVVGAYQLSLSGDGSLLQEPGILSFAGVVALGFGDIAQLEYRHTAAISVAGTSAPVPAIGVQLELPLPERRWLPGLAVALRLGVTRSETVGGVAVDESVSDLYVVSRLLLWGPLAALTLHGGLRLSATEIAVTGARAASASQRLWLPAAGFELATSPRARLVGEIGLVPRFRYDVDGAAAPTVERGVLGRLGLRWALHPTVTLDGSLGYQLEVPGAEDPAGPGAVVQWDIRMGAEVFVPWGAIACRAAGLFCE